LPNWLILPTGQRFPTACKFELTINRSGGCGRLADDGEAVDDKAFFRMGRVGVDAPIQEPASQRFGNVQDFFAEVGIPSSIVPLKHIPACVIHLEFGLNQTNGLIENQRSRVDRIPFGSPVGGPSGGPAGDPSEALTEIPTEILPCSVGSY
jgi:hypothetical protein